VPWWGKVTRYGCYYKCAYCGKESHGIGDVEKMHWAGCPNDASPWSHIPKSRTWKAGQLPQATHTKPEVLYSQILEANALHEEIMALQTQQQTFLNPVLEAANEMTVEEINWLLAKVKDPVTRVFLADKKRKALGRYEPANAGNAEGRS